MNNAETKGIHSKIFVILLSEITTIFYRFFNIIIVAAIVQADTPNLPTFMGKPVTLLLRKSR